MYWLSIIGRSNIFHTVCTFYYNVCSALAAVLQHQKGRPAPPEGLPPPVLFMRGFSWRILYIKEWEGGIRIVVIDRSAENRRAHEESLQLWEATPLQVLDSLCRRSHAVQFFGVAILPLRAGWQNRRHRASCTGNAGAAESAEETEQSPNRLHIHAGLASLYAKKCAICITNVASAIFSHQMQHPLYPTAISGRTFAVLKPLNEKHPIWKKDF